MTPRRFLSRRILTIFVTATAQAVTGAGMAWAHPQASTAAPKRTPAAQTPATQRTPTPSSQTTTPVPQPSAKTPPTPLPTKINTNTLNVKPSDIRDTTTFRNAVPGQPLSGDPTEIRTVDDALAVAFRRNPSVLLAQERAVRTVKAVDQILALKRPQISAGASYNRLSGQGASAAGGGQSPLSALQNPFSVGLNNTPPGAAPITLSSSGTSTGAAGQQTTATAGQSTSGTAGSAGTSSVTRAAARPSDNGGGGGANAAQALSNGGGRQTTTTTTGGETTGGTATGGDTTGGETTTGGNTTGGTNPNLQQFNNSGTQLNQSSARIGITQLIDITGIVRTAEQIGQLERIVTRLELARVRQETALNVKNSFYNLLRAQAYVGVNEAAVAQSAELLRVTTAQKNAGVASEFDVLRASTQLDNNRQALISSRNQVAIAKNALANLIGIDPSTPVNPTIPTIPAPADLDETALVDLAFTRRPEYLQADANITKAARNVRLARRNLEPAITASITGAYNITDPGFGDRTNATAGLALSVPLDDGGATRAAVAAARSDERGSLIQKDQFVRGIKAEVQQAIIAVRDATERQTAAAGTVTQAREALRLANVRFQAGVSTQLEVNDAQTALTQAETNLVNAQFDYLGALARLSRATGEPQ